MIESSLEKSSPTVTARRGPLTKLLGARLARSAKTRECGKEGGLKKEHSTKRKEEEATATSWGARATLNGWSQVHSEGTRESARRSRGPVLEEAESKSDQNEIG